MNPRTFIPALAAAIGVLAMKRNYLPIRVPVIEPDNNRRDRVLTMIEPQW